MGDSGLDSPDDTVQDDGSTFDRRAGSGSSRQTGPSDPEAAGSAIGSQSSTGAPRPQIEPRTAREALFLEELARTRMFSVLSLIMCAFVLAGFPFLGGNQLLKIITIVGCAISIVPSFWIIFSLRDPSRYSQTKINASATLSIFSSYAGILYWGIFSPAPMIFLFGLYFLTRSQSLQVSLFLYMIGALAQGIAAIFILTGFVPDPGLVRAEDASVMVRISTQVVIQFLFAITFIIARASRRGTLHAMSNLLVEKRRAAEREAAFQEVRQDLDRFLGLGGAGHHTGAVVGSGWQLGRVIGRGAMGEVYEAHQKSGDRAAVKLLHPSVQSRPAAIERFFREAKAASALESHHSVRILEVADMSSRLPFLVMEFLRGHDLAYFLREHRRLLAQDLVVLVTQIGEAVDAAARARIVHRDLKPQNLFLAEGSGGAPVWKVLDYGASKLADSTGTLTEGRVVGTPSYMSPQQAKAEEVDFRADLYALAAIAYRSITGRAPYSGKDLPTTLYRVVYGTPPQPSLLVECSAEMEAVLAIGLAKEPEDRFASGLELSRAVAEATHGRILPDLAARAQQLLQRQPWGIKPKS